MPYAHYGPSSLRPRHSLCREERKSSQRKAALRRLHPGLIRATNRMSLPCMNSSKDTHSGTACAHARLFVVLEKLIESSGIHTLPFAPYWHPSPIIHPNEQRVPLLPGSKGPPPPLQAKHLHTSVLRREFCWILPCEAARLRIIPLVYIYIYIYIYIKKPYLASCMCKVLIGTSSRITTFSLKARCHTEIRVDQTVRHLFLIASCFY